MITWNEQQGKNRGGPPPGVVVDPLEEEKCQNGAGMVLGNLHPNISSTHSTFFLYFTFSGVNIKIRPPGKI